MFVALLMLGAVWPGMAQTQLSQRQLRTYIPPEQLVSFETKVSFDLFLETINPIAKRALGKTIVDPDEHTQPIGIPVRNMHFFDALELVLDHHGLTYRETERYVIVQPPPKTSDTASSAANAASKTSGANTQTAKESLASEREVKIDAVLFEVNLSRARELGINWNALFGESGGSKTSGEGGGGEGFTMKADDLLEGTSQYLDAPNQFPISTLTDLFRVFENKDLGKTIANPRITVQSGEQGSIQIGSDIPIQIRDFAGNTTTDFIQTGIIVDVTPTLFTRPVADTLGAPRFNVVHLDVQVEKSTGNPSSAGPIVSKSQASTQVLLLDDEQTVIGGLYSTERTKSRRGVPVLKDLPKWFFGLRYIFGYTQTSVVRKELLIVLKAQVLKPLNERLKMENPKNLRDAERKKWRQQIEQLDEKLQPSD